MKSIKNILKGVVFFLSSFIILTIIYTTISYFNLLPANINNVIKLIIPILCFSLAGFMVGKNADKNGWLEGLKISIVIAVLMTIITAILKSFKIEYLLYILVLTIAGVFGSMIGINKAK